MESKSLHARVVWDCAFANVDLDFIKGMTSVKTVK